MPVVFVVPIRSFHLGKSRLAEVMGPDERGRLARSLATHVVTTLRDSRVEVAVTTADPAVVDWARGDGMTVIADPGAGLDAAASTSARWVSGSGRDWVIIHGDLPLLTTADVDAVRSGLETSGSVIAPSSDGGTSAIGSTRHIEFGYGPGSFHRHLARLGDPSIVVRNGLLLDVDSGRDLRAATLRTGVDGGRR